jgi:hypothetical protein
VWMQYLRPSGHLAPRDGGDRTRVRSAAPSVRTHRRSGTRPLGFAALVVLLLLGPGVAPVPGLDQRLARVAGAERFDLVGWEVGTLTARVAQTISAPAPVNRVDLVERYFTLSREAARARAARDAAWARGPDGQADLMATQHRLESLQTQLTSLEPTVEATISAQLEAAMRADQIRRGLVTWLPVPGTPFARPSIVPPVFFQLGPLPELLAVAPRDRIALVDSMLVEPGVTPRQVERLEHGADALGFSSVVTDIGGLSAYPSMLPDTDSAQDLLVTVAHEWTHQYLALRPLGQHYGDSYDMIEINETVADMVGHELGTAVYTAIYQPLTLPAPPPSRPSGPPRPDFWSLIRQIRLTVEADLARGDVAGADAYMAAQPRALARAGYAVRKVNTAYLAFFGSYANSANPYEEPLRRLRSRSGSLVAFLQTVAQVRTPADLQRLAGP